VARFAREDCEAYHARLVRAQNLVLAVAGDVDPDQVAARIGAHLAELDGGVFAAPAPEPEPPAREAREAELRKDRAQAHLVIGFQGLTVHDPDRHPLEVIAQILAGQSGRLFLELRDRRSLAYALNATNAEGLAPGFFAVYIATAPDKLAEARRGILDELERLLAAPPGEDELARARRYLVGNFAIDRQRNVSRAAQTSADARYGLGPDAAALYPERIRAVTADDVLRVARRVLDLDAFALAAIRP
jgi:zinc protease